METQSVTSSSNQEGPPGSTPAGGGHLRRLAAQAAASLGLELVHLTYRREGSRWVLRVFVDREGGVTLDDCSRASEQLGALLEVADVIPHSYTLEVSSPGLDRPLVGPRDYIRFAGHRATLKTYQPLDGRRNFTGTLAGCAHGRVLLDTPDGESVAIPLDMVASGRLKPDLDGAGAPPRGRPGWRDDTSVSETVKE